MIVIVPYQREWPDEFERLGRALRAALGGLAVRLGRSRWEVERTGAWLKQDRRLRIRYERRADLQRAFLQLGCTLICWNVLVNGVC